MTDWSLLLDPELRPVMGEFSLPPPTMENVLLMRQGMAGIPIEDPPDSVERVELEVGEDPAISIRIHRPLARTGPSPAVVAMHGGGLIFGSYEMDIPVLDRWCHRFGVTGLSVQYRLAPEHPYPTPLEDGHAVLRWAHRNADELGIDPDNIGLYGVSAGGGLAAGLALLARDRGEVPVAFQVLECPMLDDRQTSHSISKDDLFVWTRTWNEFGWRSYLGDRYQTPDVPGYAAAGRASDLGGLPPSFISVGSIDGFADEDIEYATKLIHAGVPCELHVYRGLPHGYNLVPNAAAVRLATTDLDNWLERQLAATTSGSDREQRSD